MTNASQKQPILDAFAKINQALDALCLHIHDDLTQLPVWIKDSSSNSFTHQRDKVLYALKKFSPTIGLSAKETYSCPGVIAGTEQTLALITEVNAAKDDFQTLIGQYRQRLARNATPYIRQVLLDAGFGAIKLKMVYRHIKHLSQHPAKISWAQGKHSTNITLSIQDLQKRLLKAGAGEHIEIQLAKLSLLKQPNLIRHIEAKPLWIANYSIKQESGISQRGLLRTGLPIFYIHDPAQPIPQVIFSAKSTRAVKYRADKLLEDEAFLTSIHAFRYKN